VQLDAVFAPTLIDLDLVAATKEEAIRLLVNRMDAAGVLIDRQKYVAAVFEREAQTPTAVGMGVAIPHGKTDAVHHSAVALGRSKGTAWDTETVELIFLLAVPESGATTDHLEILASLAQLLLDDNFRRALLAARTADEAFTIITGSIRSLAC